MSEAKPISRLAVLDRGETAVRVLNAAGELNHAGGAPPIATVLFHREAEAQPWYGREADDVQPIAAGEEAPAAAIAALARAQIDTLWLGEWSPGPRADFIAACAQAGITVVGPDAATVRRLADAGGLEALGLVGSIDGALPRRRVEIDILADRHGTVWAFGDRDVTVQHGGQPLLVEAPCAIDPPLLRQLHDAARVIARESGYIGAGVVRFVHDGSRFAVEGVDAAAAPHHATTEERTGASIIGWRLRVQRGEALPPQPPAGEGVAVAARVFAESAEDGPPGGRLRVELLKYPVGTGVRIDANRRRGDPVDDADPLLAVVTAWGPDRGVALARVLRALQRSAVAVDGGASNRTLLLQLLRDDDYGRGAVDTGWVDRLLAARRPASPDPVALLAAAAQAYEDDRALAQAAFLAAAARGRPEQPADVGSRIELFYAGASHRLEVDRVGARNYTVRCGDAVADIAVDALGHYERRVTCGGRRHRLLVAPTDTGFRVEMDGSEHRIDREDGVVVAAGRPALVVAMLVAPGARVAKGDPIAVLESMKMESTVTAPIAGEVVSVAVGANAQVEAGAALVRLRAHPAGRGDAAQPCDLKGLESRIDPTRKACQRVYEPLGNYLLGYDLAPAALRRLLTEQRRMAEIAAPDDAALAACEDGLLDIYADLGALYRPQTEAEPDDLLPPSENTQEQFLAFVQWLDADRAGLPAEYRERLLRALGRFGVASLERAPALEAALMWLFRSFARVAELAPVVTAILQRRIGHRDALLPLMDAAQKARLDRLIAATHGRQQAIADLARDVRFHFYDEPTMQAAAAELRAEMAGHLHHLARHPDAADRAQRIARLVWNPQSMRSLLLDAWRGEEGTSAAALRRVVLEAHLRRFYRFCRLGEIRGGEAGGLPFAAADYALDDEDAHVVVAYLPLPQLAAWSKAIAPQLAALPASRPVVIDVAAWRDGARQELAEAAAEVGAVLARCEFGRPPLRVDVELLAAGAPSGEPFRIHHLTFVPEGAGFVEDRVYRDLHPMLSRRLEIWRLANFELERRPAPEDMHLFLGVARSNKDDRRLFALAEIREVDPVTDPHSGQVSYPRLQRAGLLALAAMRNELARYTPRDRPAVNRLVLDVRAPWNLPPEHVDALAHHFAPLATRVGLEKVVLKVRRPDGNAPGGQRLAVLQFESVGNTVLVSESQPGAEPIRPLGAYQQKVLTAARFGSPYPYEIARLLTRRGAGEGLPADSFRELDLDAEGQLVPVEREPGLNKAHIVVGLITNHTAVVPEGMTRVALLSDPTQGLGNLAEPECRRINAALAYALARRLPVEWFAVSSGALIAMDSGTENMDWIALTLRRLIEYTQAGGEINIVVTGINVGGQPYWNAEATMLMHTRGILVMTPASAMVLTGKQALDFSGAVSAEDNFGIGGYDRIMGPNGQGQYWAPSFPEACNLLLRHYEFCYVVPGERFPRRRPTADPRDRDVRASPHAKLAGSPFATIGDLFSMELNPERKQPFDMRSVMRAVADADAEPLERWKDLRDGENSIVWDTTIGGIPVLLLGIESHNVRRKGFVPADGPPTWTSGTLFPHASRKTARAINAASGMRPLVVLANLSGFDGSPESMRRRQLEFGAEIGRAVTNFDGPIVFVVVSRYHGGAFVVFSKQLNESMEIAAVEGSVASVIGGTPAAATVFAREVKQRTDADPRVKELRAKLAAATGAGAAKLRGELAGVTEQVRSEKLGVVAGEFDAIHTVERARRVGSVDRIIAARELRPYVIDALERGMARFGPGASRH
jgi:acetyl/propionyl-CoA carboxylase alpha subunit/acetyl-CoA carboxylase carboxyltransferase component